MTMADAHYLWQKQNCSRVSILLNNNTDADILAHLQRQASKQGYIKELIRKDILRSKIIDEYLSNSPTPTQGYEIYNANPYMDKEAEE